MGLSREEKRALMQDLMVGKSTTVSANFRIAAVGASKSDVAITVETGVGGYNAGGSYTPVSRTWHILTIQR